MSAKDKVPTDSKILKLIHAPFRSLVKLCHDLDQGHDRDQEKD